MNAPLTLAQLAAAWQAAKADERAANARRLEIEEQIVELFPPAVEGTETLEQDGLKIKVAFKLTRTVDTKAPQAHWNSLSAFAQDIFTWKADLSLPAMRRLQENHPDLYPSVAVFITSKPAKPAVTVEGV